MVKKSILTVLIFVILMVAVSGCTTKTAANGTFGEKKISLDALKIENVTAEHFTYNETLYYSITGNVTNKNDIDAINVKMEATAYDEDGNLVATNSTPYLSIKNIPSGSTSLFYFLFTDPDNRIVRYEIKIIDAKSQF